MQHQTARTSKTNNSKIQVYNRPEPTMNTPSARGLQWLGIGILQCLQTLHYPLLKKQMKTPKNIGIYDPNPVTIAGFKSLFDQKNNFKIGFLCQNHENLVANVRKYRPGILLMEGVIEGGLGIKIISKIKELWPKTRILVLSFRPGKFLNENLLAAGASQIICKRESIFFVFNLLERLIEEGGHETHPKLERQVNEMPIDLSRRETAVLTHIIGGKPNKQIADLEFISHHTVDFHRRNLFKKFHASNTAELVRKAISIGFREESSSSKNYGFT